jgi:hypothetical protein
MGCAEEHQGRLEDHRDGPGCLAAEEIGDFPYLLGRGVFEVATRASAMMIIIAVAAIGR